MAVLQTITLTPMQEQPPVPMRTSDTQEQFNVKTQNLMMSWGTNVTIWNNNLTTLNTGLNAALAVAYALPDVERVAQSADNIDRVALSAGNIDIVSAHVSGIDAVALHVDSVDTVAGNMDSVNTAASNMSAIIDAPNEAQAAAVNAAAALVSEQAARTSENAAKDSETAAATSATDAGACADEAAESAAKAREWAEKAEDTPVETGKYSALHWAEKSRSAALTALGGIPLIEAGDDGKALVADGETLAWVKGPSFTATPAAGAVPKADASGKLNAWVDVPTPWSPGDIKMWFGELDTSGKHPLINGMSDTRWHVCDGTDGTPDMRDRVPVGASEAKAKGTSGGSADHTHTVSVSVAAHPETACTGATASASPSGSCAAAYSGVSSSTGSAAVSGSVGATTLSVSQMPSHNHVIRNGATGTGTIPPMALIEGTANTTPTQYAGGSGSHTHSFSGGSHSHSISESTHSHSVSISAHTHGIGTVKTPPLAHSASATSAEANSLPPYVALHFLMYIGE